VRCRGSHTFIDNRLTDCAEVVRLTHRPRFTPKEESWHQFFLRLSKPQAYTNGNPLFSGLVLPSGQKLTLGLLTTVTLEVVPFRVYAPFPALLTFFKRILEVVFCEGVQHRLRFCLHHLSCDKTASFRFYLQSGKQKSRVKAEV
jgi:hypothetical protein